MRVKASDPSHPIRHTISSSLPAVLSLPLAFPAYACKAALLYFPFSHPVSSMNRWTFSRDVCLHVLIFREKKRSRNLRCHDPVHRLPKCDAHASTYHSKPDLRDTFSPGGSIWIIQYVEFKVGVFIKQAAGVRECNILDELISSNPCLSLGWAAAFMTVMKCSEMKAFLMGFS